MRKIIEIGIVGATFLAIAAFFFYPLFYPKLQMFVHPDYGLSELWHQSYASKYFLQQSLHNGELPLWNPLVATGFPEFAKAEIGALHLPNVALLSLLNYPDGFPVAINVLYVVAFLTAASGLYVYARLHTFTRTTALFSAVIFAFSGYFFTHIPHISRLQTAAMIPFVLVAFEYVLRKPSGWTAGIFALVASQQLYAGHFQMVFITWLLIIATAVYWMVRKKMHTRNIIFAAIGMVLFGLLIAVQMLPAIELINNTSRAEGFSQQAALRFSYPWRQLRAFIDPFVFGSPHTGDWPHYNLNDGDIFWENTGFIGVLGFVLAGLGFAAYVKMPFVRFLGVGLVGSLLLMTGKYSPLYFIHSIQPFSFFRAPSKYIIIFVLALSLLAGLGLKWLSGRLSNISSSKRLPWLVGMAALVIVVYELFTFQNTYAVTDDPDNWLSNPPVIEELSNTDEYRYISFSSKGRWNNVLLDTGWQTLDEYQYLRNALEPNINLFYNVPAFGVYEILETNRQKILIDMFEILLVAREESEQTRKAFNSFLDMMSLRYLVTASDQIGLSEPTVIPAPDAYVERDLPEVRVYTHESALPRARLSQNFIHIATARELLGIIGSDAFDPAMTIFVEDDIPFEPVEENVNGTVEIVQSESMYVELAVQSDQEAILLLADSYEEGWKAFVNGKETPVYPANINQRAVVVPAGESTVAFRYEPAAFVQGQSITLAGLAITILLMVVSSFAQDRVIASSTAQQLLCHSDTPRTSED